jgi:hypothetical protein
MLLRAAAMNPKAQPSLPLLILATGLVASSACAPSNSEMRPYLSAAQHETTAAHLERRADALEERYQPGAGMCRGRPQGEGGVCWTSLWNPTEAYLRHAEAHRREAEAHRAAALELREAERQACTGLSEADRDVSPFDHYEDIVQVEPLHGGVSRYLQEPWTEGVVVTFRPVTGMTVASLQRIVDCQIARNAALGNDVPRLQHCLLVPRGVRATVAAVPAGFTVTIRADDRQTAEEIIRRADLLSTALKQSNVR